MEKKVYDKEVWEKEGRLRCIEKWMELPEGGFLILVWSETEHKWVKKED